ncbi:MAG: GNAT family N-acetyltransferase [Pirellulales bacterium]|nr:GNAT family N-acetyltransferase [Pirellulales bacterium]
MIGYRSFRNSDPPHLAGIWRMRSGLRSYAQPMTAALLERMVFAKPYFDETGLIVATEDDQPIAFGHAGFGPTDDESALDYEFGASILIVVAPHADEAAIAAQLIDRCEQYLRRRGAKVLYGGGIKPLNAFYLGLYGGSELPGILDSDPQHQQFFRAAGYREIDRTMVLHRELTNFRPVVDRQQLLLRRRSEVDAVDDPPAKSWWESCIFNSISRVKYTLQLCDLCAAAAEATLIDMEIFSQSWGVRTAGLIDVNVPAVFRRQGMAARLLCEVLRRAAEEGVALVEVQTMRQNTAALALYKKLGFRQADSGAVFRKE